MNRTVLIVGVAITLALVAVLFVGLGKDPAEIKSPLIGKPAPEFALKAVGTGQTIDIAALRGKPVVLNFWATWCGPCKEEMPALDRLSRQFADKDVAVLTITNDPERRGIEHFMKQVGSSLPVLLDEQRDVSLAFMVRGLPTTVFVGKNGTILGRAVGPRAWDSPDAVGLIRSLREARP